MASETDEFMDEADFEKHDAFFTKDTPVGSVLKGTVVEAPRVIETEDIGSTTRSKKLVLAVRDDSGKTWSLWVKKGALATAVAAAVKKVVGENASKVPQKGSKLAVKFTGLGTASKPGFNPPKQWQAAYEAPPAAAEGVDESAIFGDEDDDLTV